MSQQSKEDGVSAEVLEFVKNQLLNGKYSKTYQEAIRTSFFLYHSNWNAANLKVFFETSDLSDQKFIFLMAIIETLEALCVLPASYSDMEAKVAAFSPYLSDAQIIKIFTGDLD